MSKAIKIGIATGVVTAALIVVIIGATHTVQKCDEACKYGTEATQVLEKYKNSDISANEAKNRIDKLVKQLNTEEKNANPDGEYYHRVFKIRMALISMSIKLMANSDVPYYEVDELIEEIENEIKK